MLITKVKDREKILDVLRNHKPFVFKCFGCREVYFPEQEIDSLLKEAGIDVSGTARIDYLCNEEFTRRYLESFSGRIQEAGRILVFSCGVGVQVVSKLVPEKIVIPGCDTLYLNGFQGVTSQNADCEQCGECWLNITGGICPLTACSKGLLNGPCGGTKNGKCEVNSEMDCGWVLIYQRLKDIENEKLLKEPAVNIRNYHLIVQGGKKTDES